MRNNYSNCEKKYDKQLALAFAAYMMAGSLFKKCVCANPLEERHLYLHYKEMPQPRQLDAEDSVLQAISDLAPAWLDTMGSLYCEARLIHSGDTYQIRFYTGGFGGLGVCIDRRGQMTMSYA